MSSNEPEAKVTLDLLIGRHLEAEKSGQNLDRDAMVEQHPEHADALREFYASHDLKMSAASSQLEKIGTASLLVGAAGGVVSILCGVAAVAPLSVMLIALLGIPTHMALVPALLIAEYGVPTGIVSALVAFIYRGRNYAPAKFGLALSIVGLLTLTALFLWKGLRPGMAVVFGIVVCIVWFIGWQWRERMRSDHRQ